MKTLLGCVDTLRETLIQGWAADSSNMNRQIFVDIYANSVLIASLRCGVFREDLRKAGFGDGCKAFQFDPSPYLRLGANQMEIRYAGTDTKVRRGGGTLVGIRGGDLRGLDADSTERLRELSQERWKGDEIDPGLTWGEILTGDSFISAVQQHYSFHPEHHICEIGPGYGRLLKTILARQLPFRKFTGVELSAERVAKLTERFGGERIAFQCADVNTVRLPGKANLIICSATFEHLFPDFSGALRNLLENNLKAGGWVAIDFPQADDDMARQSQGFEPDKHAFVRHYSAQELRAMFLECGADDVRIESIVLGRANFGDVRRIFVFAGKI